MLVGTFSLVFLYLSDIASNKTECLILEKLYLNQKIIFSLDVRRLVWLRIKNTIKGLLINV